ncbi:1-acyl-sn-glycerol-3-phosphate acyltransferase [Jiulongibacter sp. NS-SX5]|uniref:1-acyl-sn-glycerol-3-phosphate acyltransferase n=1 Tax=Jiulongibacter sp. NS-SX5 TaxID=3463854 RepID=UPI004059EA3A
MSAIFRFFFKVFGWKVVGTVPTEVKKAVIAVCPHTKWQDFFVGLGARAELRRTIGYLGKEELFKPPFGFIFKSLGGTPVVRHKNMNLVQSYIEAIQKADDMLFALAPEGTRKNVEKLKSGFYYMAHGGGIPIIPVAFNFEKKQVILGDPFSPTGNFAADMQQWFVPFFQRYANVEKDWIKNYADNKSKQ